MDRNVIAEDRTVKFVIGTSDLHTFTISKAKAASASRIFKLLFEGLMIEGQTQTMTMVDVDPKTFAYFAEWMERRELRDLIQVMAYARLWVLANKYFVFDLEELICVAIISLLDRRDDVHGTGAADCQDVVDFFDFAYNTETDTSLKKISRKFVIYQPDLKAYCQEPKLLQVKMWAEVAAELHNSLWEGDDAEIEDLLDQGISMQDGTTISDVIGPC